MGNDNFTAAPSGTFATADGHINIAANKQEQWEALADVLGVPELKTRSAVRRNGTRGRENRKALTPLLEARLAARATAEWVEALNARGVPSGEILGLGAALSQAQVRHRRSLRDVAVPGIGTVPLFGLTAKFEETPGELDAPPPRLSAHTDEILGGARLRARRDRGDEGEGNRLKGERPWA